MLSRNSESFQAFIKQQGSPLSTLNADELKRFFRMSYTITATWSAVWSRPGLPRHTHSLLNIAILTALNHHAELALYMRSAENHGVTPAEVGIFCRSKAIKRKGLVSCEH
jgi:alkylhydroperoxidase/carboxymuconolactone decarboxylase family protein YurZ